jgi:hypothetical protein
VRTEKREGRRNTQKQKPIVRDGVFSMTGTPTSSLLSCGGPLFFESSHTFVQTPHRLFERCHCPDKRPEGDLHIVEIGADQVEDIGHCLEAGVNFVVESIETLPDGEELLLGQGGKLVYRVKFLLWHVYGGYASSVARRQPLSRSGLWITSSVRDRNGGVLTRRAERGEHPPQGVSGGYPGSAPLLEVDCRGCTALDWSGREPKWPRDAARWGLPRLSGSAELRV